MGFVAAIMKEVEQLIVALLQSMVLLQPVVEITARLGASPVCRRPSGCLGFHAARPPRNYRWRGQDTLLTARPERLTCSVPARPTKSDPCHGSNATCLGAQHRQSRGDQGRNHLVSPWPSPPQGIPDAVNRSISSSTSVAAASDCRSAGICLIRVWTAPSTKIPSTAYRVHADRARHGDGLGEDVRRVGSVGGYPLDPTDELIDGGVWSVCHGLRMTSPEPMRQG